MRMKKGLPADAWLYEKQVIGELNVPNISTLEYDKLVEFTDHETATAALLGEINDYEGRAGVAYELAKQASERITEQDTDDHFEAFENVARGWPQELRALVAAYETVEADREAASEQYRKETERFANKLDYLHLGELTLDDRSDPLEDLELFYDRNPYDDPELDDDEAEIVLKVRLMGLDESPLDFSEIEDFDDFLYWLNDTESIETATTFHTFGQVENPSTVASVFIPPDEWQTIDSPHHDSCIRCEREVLVGEDSSGPVAALTNEAARGGIVVREDCDNDFIFFQGDVLIEGPLCGRCYDSVGNFDTIQIGQLDGVLFGVRGRSHLYKDLAHQNPELSPVADLNRSVQEVIERNPSNGPFPREWYAVTNSPDDVPTHRVFSDLAVDPASVDIGGAPLILKATEREVSACFPADSPQGARIAKQMMNGERPITAEA